MTTSESKRLDLYNALQELLGRDRASYLMSRLLPTEMPDLLTRSEFDAGISQLTTAVANLDKRLDNVDRALESVNKRIDRVLLAVVGGMFLILAAVISSGMLS